MKAASTIRKHQRELRALIEDESTDLLTKRIAYEIDLAIRWAREDVVGWPSPAQQAKEAAALLRRTLFLKEPA